MLQDFQYFIYVEKEPISAIYEHKEGTWSPRFHAGRKQLFLVWRKNNLSEFPFNYFPFLKITGLLINNKRQSSCSRDYVEESDGLPNERKSDNIMEFSSAKLLKLLMACHKASTAPSFSQDKKFSKSSAQKFESLIQVNRQRCHIF